MAFYLSFIEDRFQGLVDRLNRLDQEVAALIVINFNHPKVRINTKGPGQIGVQIRLGLSLNRLHPDALTLSGRGLRKQPKLSGPAIDQLNQNRASPKITLAFDRSKRAAQFSAAD
jgi:hypothetical protein